MCVPLHHGSFAPSMFHHFFYLFSILCNIFRGFISFDGVYINTVDPTADLQSNRLDIRCLISLDESPNALFVYTLIYRLIETLFEGKDKGFFRSVSLSL